MIYFVHIPAIQKFKLPLGMEDLCRARDKRARGTRGHRARHAFLSRFKTVRTPNGLRFSSS